MSKEYIYEASEQTVDVRSWTIKSDRQLTEDEVTDIYQDSINQEWSCYCNEINSVRHRYGMDSKVFTPSDKQRFANAYKKNHLV